MQCCSQAVPIVVNPIVWVAIIGAVTALLAAGSKKRK